MDALLLIAFNLVFVPFLQEAELLGRTQRRVPGVSSVLRLAGVRRSAWFRPSCVLAAFFGGIVLAASGRHPHSGAILLALGVLAMQAVLWTLVLRNIPRASPSQARRSARPYGPRPLAALTVY